MTATSEAPQPTSAATSEPLQPMPAATSEAPQPTPAVPTEGPAASVTGTITIASVASAAFILLVVIVITTLLIFRLRRAQKTKDLAISSTRDDNSTEGEENTDVLPMRCRGDQSLASVELMSLPRTLIIPASQLHLKDTIGQGEFGIVYKALFKQNMNSETEIVAVKTLKGMFTSKDVQGLVEEVMKMQAFHHSHVMPLIGVCLDGGAGPAIVMPYMANGSLLNYLRKERGSLLLDENASPNKVSRTQKFLLNICLQIAEGMEYLAREKVVHRDLSARNCMIDAEGVIKVADFGLSVDVYSTNYYRQGKEDEEMKFPIRWMAVESIIDGIYTKKSDVWSFGVTLWEVYSGGKLPYPGMTSPALIRHVASGERLSKPENVACSDEVYYCMQQCWLEDAGRRPDFRNLVTTISNMLESNHADVDASASIIQVRHYERTHGDYDQVQTYEETGDVYDPVQTYEETGGVYDPVQGYEKPGRYDQIQSYEKTGEGLKATSRM